MTEEQRVLQQANLLLQQSQRNLSQAVLAARRASRRNALAIFLLVLALGVMASHLVVYGW